MNTYQYDHILVIDHSDERYCPPPALAFFEDHEREDGLVEKKYLTCFMRTPTNSEALGGKPLYYAACFHFASERERDSWENLVKMFHQIYNDERGHTTPRRYNALPAPKQLRLNLVIRAIITDFGEDFVPDDLRFA